VRYGRTVPIKKGYLPAFSVDTEEEARSLLVMSCGTNMNGEFVAKELVYEQTLDNLWAFSDRLKVNYERMKKVKDGKL